MIGMMGCDHVTDPRPTSEVLLARQPILNGDLTAVGYELLYRATASERADVHDHELATARVSLNAMTEIDLVRLVDERRAWINVTREFVLGGLAQTIPPDRVVLELLEDQVVDVALVDALTQLRADGYLVALDDFTLTPEVEPLLPMIDIVKLDLRALGAEGLTRLAHELKPHRVTLVAEKLEDHADFEIAVAAGCDLFQGYFFCRPELIEGTAVAPNQLALLQLAADLQDPAVDLAALDRVISTDVALSYRLLRYINSAYFSVRQPVSTVMQAVTLLGIENVRSWTTMMILAKIGGSRASCSSPRWSARVSASWPVSPPTVRRRSCSRWGCSLLSTPSPTGPWPPWCGRCPSPTPCATRWSTAAGLAGCWTASRRWSQGSSAARAGWCPRPPIIISRPSRGPTRLRATCNR